MYKGSTDQKTGESMEKPGKKLKKFFIITGITGMVYAGLKYLLPLVVPLLWLFVKSWGKLKVTRNE